MNATILRTGLDNTISISRSMSRFWSRPRLGSWDGRYLRLRSRSSSRSWDGEYLSSKFYSRFCSRSWTRSIRKD